MKRLSSARLTLRRLASIGAASAVALMVSACGSSSKTSTTGASPTTATGTAIAGGDVSFALPPNSTPDWVFPIGTTGHLATYNTSIDNEMYLPLYNYDTSSGSLALSNKISAANPPVYSDGNRVVTITLKSLNWSNGKPLTSRDVEFWFNLIKANKAQWGNYSTGNIPDNITSFKIVNQHTFQLGLDHSYNPEWFTANQLSLITPMPQAAWDIETTGGTVGNYDQTTAGAKKVFAYLVAQSSKISSYDSSPLWKVTNGPFTLQTYPSDGDVVLVKSKTYNGPEPARIETLSFKPFTSAEAEFNVLMSGGVDYGYVPTTDLSQISTLESNGYRIEPWVGWAITYIPFNFNNPKLGSAFKQLYVRQALQMTINQSVIVKDIWHGMAAAGYGPIPQTPVTSFLSTVQANNPYPYNTTKAKALLTSHGWAVSGGSDMTCERPGTGADECGSGVAKGTKLQLTILSESGDTETNNLMQELQTSFSDIGVGLNVKTAPLNTVLDDSGVCKPTQAMCSWQLSFFGTQGSWYFPAYPSGEQIFATNAGTNLGSYSSASADALIRATNVSGSTTAMQAYSADLAKDLPVLWVPSPDYQVSAIKSKLGGVLQNPLASMQAEQWYWTK